MEMGAKFLENDIFKAVIFQKIFVKSWLFQQRFDDGSLQIT